MSNLIDRLNRIFTQQSIADTAFKVKMPVPGEIDSYFTLDNGMVGMKSYLMPSDQKESVTYGSEYRVVDCKAIGIAPWVEEQDITLWKYSSHDGECHPAFVRFVMHESLVTLMMLRWA
jgi:hypothetical protein